MSRVLTPLTLAALLLVPGRLAAQAPLPDWIRVDHDGRTVELTLTVRPGGPDGPAALNGHARGDVQLVVPLGWTVRWTWVNQDSTRPHSLVVMTEREKLPAEAGRPAFDNAYTRRPAAGLAAGRRDVTTFVADQAGWYWMLCGVPGHALEGEWIGLRVDPDARAPALKPKP